MRRLLELEVPANAESLKPIRDALERALGHAGLPDQARQRLKLVVDEAAANVIRHAYGNRGEGEMEITVEITRGWLRIALRDRAPPVDPSRIQPRDLSVCRPGGLGINFIDETMDRWRITPLKRGRGNRLTMFKRLSAARAADTNGERG
jgi:anti-sigma regulatory factor (Ser/Thr protein kinase)